jgi:hypothetical protein
LNEGDFEQVALSGFDAADHAVDFNDYAWSMEHFKGDGDDGDGYVYVGTWNRVQMWKGFQEHFSVYPEIRRYRPDISPTSWEPVLDTRDLGVEDADRPHGFRYMKAYRNQSDGRLCLYAGGRGDKTTLWRSETGDPGSWECFWTLPQEGSIRAMAVHEGLLYLAFFNDYAMVGGSDKAAEQQAIILATDGATVWTVSDDGFGNANNVGIFVIESFNGWLYAGTQNPKQGCEVWKLEGPDKAAPVRVVRGGGPRWLNEAAMTMSVFQDHLYVGMQASFIMRMLGGLKPADLLRIDTADNWEVVAGPGSIGGEKSGFGEKGNAYIWSMCEHDGWFYAGTYDIMPGLAYMLTHPEYLLGVMGIQLKEASPEMANPKCLTVIQLIAFKPNAGADLYKTQDGKTWYCVNVDGFGKANNYGFRTMASAGGKLFVGTANPYDGLEVWAGGQPPTALEVE